jgi:hypothetical protein
VHIVLAKNGALFRSFQDANKPPEMGKGIGAYFAGWAAWQLIEQPI